MNIQAVTSISDSTWVLVALLAAFIGLAVCFAYIVVRTTVGDRRRADPVFRITPDSRFHSRRVTAHHEAGHMLFIRALGAVPAGAGAVTRRNVHADQPNLGYVMTLQPDGWAITKSLSEWFMMMYLAGQIAETLRFGESSFGSSSDIQKWQSFAAQYLKEQHAGLYIHDPKSDFDMENNRALFQRILNEQTALVRSFLEKNRPVLEKVANAMLDHESLDEKAIGTLLKDAELIPGIPTPFGNATSFDHRNALKV